MIVPPNKPNFETNKYASEAKDFDEWYRENKKLIALIDLGIGNLFSLFNLFKQITKKKIMIIDKSEHLTQNKNEISHLIIPGVGSFPAAMEKIGSSDWKENIIEFKNTKTNIRYLFRYATFFQTK